MSEMNKMVILQTETLRGWGGQQNRVLAESIGFNERGHRAIIACRPGSILSQKARDARITVYELNLVKKAGVSNLYFSFICDLEFIKTANKEIIKRYNPQVLVKY